MTGKADDSGLLKTIAGIFGLFAGLASLIYIGGGAVLALRMSWNDVPNSLSVVAQLPKEFLIAAGLAQLALPALILAAIYIGGRFVRGFGKRRILPIGPTKQEWNQWFGMPPWLVEFAVVSTLISLAAYMVTLPGLFLVLASGDVEGDPWFFTIPPVAAILVMLVAVHVRAVLQGQRYKTQQSWNTLNAVFAMAAIYAFSVLPGCILFGSALPLQDVRVCAAGGAYDKLGLLVGESGDRVYIAGRRVDGRRLILTMPMDRVEQIYVGPGSWGHGGTCDKASSTSTTEPSTSP